MRPRRFVILVPFLLVASAPSLAGPHDDGQATSAPDISVPWSVGPGTILLDEGGARMTGPDERPLPLPPGSAASRIHVEACPTCGPILRIPMAQAGDPLLDAPYDLRSPYPAGDRDGDGVEDWYLIGFIYFGDAPLQNHVTALSGADGSVQAEWTFDGEWTLPVGTSGPGPDHLEMFLLNQERHETDHDGFSIFFWSSQLVAFDLETGAPVWQIEQPAHLAEDGSGWIAWDNPGWFGDYTGAGLEAYRVAGRYEWTDDIFQGTVDETWSGVVAARSLDERWARDPATPAPWTYLDDSDGRDLLAWTGDAIERRDGADYGLLATIDQALLGWSPTTAMLGQTADGPLIVAFNTTGPLLRRAGVELDGTVRWDVADTSPLQYRYPMGVSKDDGATVLGVAALGGLNLDCDGMTASFDVGAISFDDGRRLWSRAVSYEIPDMWAFAFSFTGGDVDGDGVSEMHATWLTFRFDAVYSEPCAGYLLPGMTYGAGLLSYGARDGQVLVDFGLERKGEPFFLGLAWWNPAARVTHVPIYFYAFDGTVREPRLASVSLADGTWNETTIDRRVPLLPWSGSEQGAAMYPLGLFDGDLDRVLVYWYQADWSGVGIRSTATLTVQEHARFGVYVHDVASTAQQWSYVSDAPYDVRV